MNKTVLLIPVAIVGGVALLKKNKKRKLAKKAAQKKNQVFEIIKATSPILVPLVKFSLKHYQDFKKSAI